VWWSGSGDNLENTLPRTVDLTGASSAEVAMKAWYEIEEGYDFLYAEVSADGGQSWTAIPGTVEGEDIGTDGQRPALSGSSNGEWVDLAYDLSRYAGEKVGFRLRYKTDGAVAPKGITADEIRITADGQTIFSDGAENGDAGWAADGFRRITGSITDSYANYYIAENRQYLGFDESLETGPYNFVTKTYAERFPYQNGLLVSYWDTFYTDNNVGQHPGGGLILPIDAHPRPLLQANGEPWRTRIQVYDATFGTERTDAISLTTPGGIQRFPSLPADRSFDDRDQYWYASDPDAGVKVPNTGTIIRVKSSSAEGAFMNVRIRPAQQ
jgi:immune inhibitor A